jgi:hypothetical protein
MWNEEATSWEYKNTQSAKSFMKLVCKILEVARGKGPLSWNWGVPHVKSV